MLVVKLKLKIIPVKLQHHNTTMIVFQVYNSSPIVPNVSQLSLMIPKYVHCLIRLIFDPLARSCFTAFRTQLIFRSLMCHHRLRSGNVRSLLHFTANTLSPYASLCRLVHCSHRLGPPHSSSRFLQGPIWCHRPQGGEGVHVSHYHCHRGHHRYLILSSGPCEQASRQTTTQNVHGMPFHMKFCAVSYNSWLCE